MYTGQSAPLSLKHQPMSKFGQVINSRKNRTNRIENMKSHWPWVEQLLLMSNNAEDLSTRDNRSGSNGGISSTAITTGISVSVHDSGKLKLPRIN